VKVSLRRQSFSIEHGAIKHSNQNPFILKHGLLWHCDCAVDIWRQR